MCACVIIVCMSATDASGFSRVAKGPIELTARVIGVPGEDITFNGNIDITTDSGSALSPISIIDIGELPTDIAPKGEIRFIPGNIAEVRAKIRDVLPGGGELAGSAVSAAGQTGAVDVPPGAGFAVEQAIPNFTLPSVISTETEEVREGDEPFEFEESFPIPNLTIPTRDPEGTMERLPDLTFEVIYTAPTPRAPLSGKIRIPTEVTLPPEGYITTREFQGCEEEFPEAESAVSSVEQDVTSVFNTVLTRAQRMQNLADRVNNTLPQNVVNVDIIPEEVQDVPELQPGTIGTGVGTVGPGFITDGGRLPIDADVRGALEGIQQNELQDTLSELRTIRDEINALPTTPPSPGFSTIRSRLNNARNSVEGVPVTSCQEEFSGRLDTVSERFNQTQTILNDYTSVKNQLLSSIRDVTRNPPTPEVLDGFGIPGIPEECAQALQDAAGEAAVENLRTVMEGEATAAKLTSAGNLTETIAQSNLQSESPDCFDTITSELQDRFPNLDPIDAEFRCTQEFPTLFERKDEIAAMELSRDKVEQARRLRDQIVGSPIENTDCGQLLLGQLGSIAEQQPPEVPCSDFDGYTELEQRVSDIEDLPVSGGTISNARSLLSEVQNSNLAQERPDCANNLITRLSSIIEQEPDDSTLPSLPERPQLPDRETPCAEAVGSTIRNRVSGFETDVNSAGTGTSGDRLRELRSEGSSLIEDVDNLDVREECKDGLKSRVNTGLSRIEQLRNRQERLRAIEGVDCDGEFSDISADVDNYASRVASLTSPAPGDISQLITEGEDLASRIRNNVDSQDCREEFVNRVRSAINTLQDRDVQVRTVAGEFPGEQEQRQQRIDELQGQLEELSGSLEDVGDIPEIPEQE